MLDFETVNAFLKLTDVNNPNAGETIDDFPEIKVMLDEIEHSFSEYCYRAIATVDLQKEKFYIWPKENFVALHALPVKKVNEVKIDGEPLNSDEVRITSGGIYIPENTSDKEQTVEVKYFGGFEEIPPSILRAARLQLIYEYERRNYLGAKSVSSEGTSTSYPEFGLLKEVKRILQVYKNYNKAPI